MTDIDGDVTKVPKDLKKEASLLWGWNIAAAVLHSGTAIAQLVLLFVYINKLYTSFMTITDAADVTVVMGHYPVAALLVIMGVLTATFHMLYTTEVSLVPVLLHGMNSLRWVEYSLTASLMTVAVAQLSGVSNFWLLFTFVVANCAMQFCGYIMEHHHKNMVHKSAHGGYAFPDVPNNKVDFTAFIVGSVLFVMTWTIICYFFVTNVLSAGITNLPWFVTASFIGILVQFVLFGLWQFLRFISIERGSWYGVLALAKSNRNYELGYIILSLVAKLYLSWILFGGFLAMGLAA